MARAIWNGQVLAQSDRTIVVEGNHYFPRSDVRLDLLKESPTTTFCPWKATASYYDVVVNEKVNAGAAWYYADPKPAASDIKGFIAFWKGVEVS
ncbi:MAG: DUF427 domain-containing protein [Pseudomonadota bacterium]|nr:DUF427 domain-containing protein [Pseudomonadota bacterium]